MNSLHIAPRRTLLRYSVHSLTVRDELLVKSLIRMLDHLAHQHWECVEHGADLQISGLPFYGALPAGAHVAVLRIGYPPAEGEFGLATPLRTDHLQQMLNSIGDDLERQRAAAAEIAAQQPMRGDESYRLRRWPPAELLYTTERRNLAALMSGRPQTASALHRLCGVPLAQCLEFLRDLRRADLLLGPASPAQVAQRSAASAAGLFLPSGLLARIRSRLGLQPHMA